MTTKEVLEILSNVEAVRTGGHYVYNSGKHGDAYINKDAVFPHTEVTSAFCAELAQRFVGDDVEVVIAPAEAGIVMSQWVAFHLSQLSGREVLAVYASKEGDGFKIGKGYDKIVKGRRILVAEDILTTGGSAAQVVELTRAAGGEVIGVCVLVNRGGVTTNDLGDVPRLEVLANVTLDAYEEADCPLCTASIPINTDLGHGTQYLQGNK